MRFVTKKCSSRLFGNIIICVVLTAIVYRICFVRNEIIEPPNPSKTFDAKFNANKTENFLFCLITTAPEFLETRATASNRTWAKHCDKYYFITTIPDKYLKGDDLLSDNGNLKIHQPMPLLQPAGLKHDLYRNLSDKTFLAFRYVYLNEDEYEWYIKVDDDSFIFVDNLKFFLKTKNSNGLLTYGYNSRLYVEGGYHSGGGYVLGNRAMKLLGKALTENVPVSCTNTGVEDIDVAACLRRMNVTVGQSLDHLDRERFHMLTPYASIRGHFPDWIYNWSEHRVKSGIDCCSNETISFHMKNDPEYILWLYDIWMLYKTNANYFDFHTIIDILTEGVDNHYPRYTAYIFIVFLILCAISYFFYMKNFN